MQKIFNFVIRSKTFLLFLLLFGISLTLTIQSHSYHRSKFIHSANRISGSIYASMYTVTQYLNLKQQNTSLVEENKRLRQQLLNSPQANTIDNKTLLIDTIYKVYTAEVYKNSYNKPNNIITINRGKHDGIKQDLGVITSNGIVGIVNNISNGYATVLSILSEKSRVSAQLKSTNHFGSLGWNALSPQYAQLYDVSQFAPVNIGDSIVTSGKSTIFPKGIGIGTVHSKVLDEGGDTYTIEVKLFNDMTNLGHVYIIENTDAQEIQALENWSNE